MPPALLRQPFQVLVLYLALAILHTWPLASAPHRLSLNHNADAQLNAWIVSWIAHTLPTAPTRLWQGNIFQPGEAALTLSEPLVVPAIIGAPVHWLGGSAVLLFNLLLLTGLTATAWVGWRVVTAWTGSSSAGLVAGTLLAFNAHLLTRLPHLQAAHAWGLVAMCGAAWAVLNGRGPWWWVAVAVALTAATSLHWLVFGVMSVGLMVAVCWQGRAPAVRVIVGGGAGIVAALPVLWPHLSGGIRRPLEQVADFSATPIGYLTSLSRVHQPWSAAFYTVETNVLFPGVLGIALATVGLVAGWRASTLARWALALIVVGVVLSFGTVTPIYGWVYHLFPPIQGIRAAARFGMLALFGIAILAAIGLAWMERHLSPRRAMVLGAVVLLGVTLEALHAPIRTTPFAGIPAVYSLLADEPEPVLLAEIPFYPADQAFENGEYVLNATGHWRAVMNGYSGATPMSYRRHADTIWFFPQERAFIGLRAAGATHVMVHLERFGHEAEDVARALDGRADLRLMAADRDGHRLYRLVHK
jgi:hypothetical protein